MLGEAIMYGQLIEYDLEIKWEACKTGGWVLLLRNL